MAKFFSGLLIGYLSGGFLVGYFFVDYLEKKGVIRNV